MRGPRGPAGPKGDPGEAGAAGAPGPGWVHSFEQLGADGDTFDDGDGWQAGIALSIEMAAATTKLVVRSDLVAAVEVAAEARISVLGGLYSNEVRGPDKIDLPVLGAGSASISTTVPVTGGVTYQVTIEVRAVGGGSSVTALKGTYLDLMEVS